MALFKRRQKEEKDSGSQAEQTQTEKKKGGKTSMKDLYKKDESGKKESTEKSPAQSQQKQKATKTEGASSTEKAGKKRHGIAYRILVKPIITEKSGDLGVQNKYVFEVAINANKIDVAKSIEEVYGVMPKKVNIVKRKGKRVRFGRLQGKRKDTKRAIVTLPQGKTINVYEGV